MHNEHYYTFYSLSVFSLAKSPQLIICWSQHNLQISQISASSLVTNLWIVCAMQCNIRNNQSLGKCYQPRPWALLITLTWKWYWVSLKLHLINVYKQASFAPLPKKILAVHASLLSSRKTGTSEPAFVAYSWTVTIITIILLIL